MAFQNLKPVRLAADADTPEDMLGEIGTRVMVPDAVRIPTTYVPPADSPVAGLAGYGRVTAGVQEWVMAGVQDELMRAVNRIPPEGSWKDVEARRVWRRAAETLRGLGAPAPELRPLLTALYQAAVANHVATSPPTEGAP